MEEGLRGVEGGLRLGDPQFCRAREVAFCAFAVFGVPLSDSFDDVTIAAQAIDSIGLGADFEAQFTEAIPVALVEEDIRLEDLEFPEPSCGGLMAVEQGLGLIPEFQRGESLGEPEDFDDAMGGEVRGGGHGAGFGLAALGEEEHPVLNVVADFGETGSPQAAEDIGCGLEIALVDGDGEGEFVGEAFCLLGVSGGEEAIAGRIALVSGSPPGEVGVMVEGEAGERVIAWGVFRWLLVVSGDGGLEGGIGGEAPGEFVGLAGGEQRHEVDLLLIGIEPIADGVQEGNSAIAEAGAQPGMGDEDDIGGVGMTEAEQPDAGGEGHSGGGVAALDPGQGAQEAADGVGIGKVALPGAVPCRASLLELAGAVESACLALEVPSEHLVIEPGGHHRTEAWRAGAPDSREEDESGDADEEAQADDGSEPQRKEQDAEQGPVVEPGSEAVLVPEQEHPFSGAFRGEIMAFVFRIHRSCIVVRR